MTGKFNALLRTFVSLSVIGASVVFGTTPAAAAVTCSQRSLNVVAHEDDDLLFMNPDIQHDISAGVCVTTVFLTAGDDGQNSDYWLGREAGSQSAYQTMLGAASTWTTSQRSFAGHSVHTMTSSGGAIDLIYLRLPDGGDSGTGFPATGNQSLSQLYSGSISSIRAVDGSATYSRSDLIATIAAILSATGPSVVRVQDGRNGQNDHPDHQMAALFTLEALAGFTGTVKAYRGYGVVNDPANVSGNDLALKTSAVVSYANHDPLLCDPQNCPSGVVAQWTERQYTASLPWSLTPVAGPAPYSGPDVARNASVLASSQVVGQEATKAIDGVVSGYPDNPGAEWSSAGQGSGAWIQLYWSSAQTIDRVYLYDRPNGGDQVTGGTLTFSDGSSVSVPSLNNDGSATMVTFAARSVTTLRFAVTSVSATTSNVGLAELEAYKPTVSAGAVTISGTPVAGSPLTASPGSWQPSDVSLSYQWRLDGTAIPGATTATYTPTLADVGHAVSVAVTGSKVGYVEASAVSAPATVAMPSPSVVAGLVSISGSPILESTLTASVGTWAPTDVALAYQWRRDGADIPGASAATYTLVVADIGHTLSVAVTGTKDGYAPATSVSAATGVVQPKDSIAVGAPTIAGTAAVSGTLTVQPGSWTPSDVTLGYQWRRDSTPIIGATATSYQPTTADVGHTLTVAVTGTKEGFPSATAISAATAAIQSSTSVLAYEAFVKASYKDFLGRVPSAGEVAFQATALSQGRVSKADYLASLSRSDEWLSAIVTKMYKDTLNRDPDAAGLADWVSWLRSGRFTVAEVASRFYSSNEYYSLHAVNTASSWVTLLYQKLLNRDPDPQGLQFWINWTNNPKFGRDWVAYNFYQSEESRMRRVEAMYQALLFREPDQVGWPFWTARVLWTGDLTLAWEIANSDEYWDKAHTRY